MIRKIVEIICKEDGYTPSNLIADLNKAMGAIGTETSPIFAGYTEEGLVVSDKPISKGIRRVSWKELEKWPEVIRYFATGEGGSWHDEMEKFAIDLEKA